MFNVDLISIVLGVTIGIGGAVTALFPLLKKKGINTEKILEDSNEVLKATGGVISVVDKLMPNNPAVNVLKCIDKYACIAVKQAEQLYLTSQLPADERNVKAKETINAALKSLNIEVTPEIQKVIDGAIEAEVLALGHKNKTDQEKEAEKQELLVQLSQSQQENTQLKQTISQIQSTLTPQTQG